MKFRNTLPQRKDVMLTYICTMSLMSFDEFQILGFSEVDAVSQKTSVMSLNLIAEMMHRC